MRRFAATVVVLVGLAVLAPTGCSDADGSDEAFCAALPDVPELAAVLDHFERSDPESALRNLDGAVERYRELEAAAPGDIRDEVATVVDLVERIADALGTDPDDPNEAAALLAEIEPDAAEVADAAEGVAAYASSTCGVEINPPDSEGEAPPSNNA
ncbi:hypothetical protein BH24ACT3_BH24ACT3_05260 [soil metagenome]